MRTGNCGTTRLAARARATLLCLVSATLVAGAAAQAAEVVAKFLPPGKARMNVLFLDDAAELPAGAASRPNHWPEWDARLPTFQQLLRTFVADFRKAQRPMPEAEATLYGLEVASGMPAAERDRLIAEALAGIDKSTARPTLVLARSTAGADQLRMVFVFDTVCPPKEAAAFLAALSEVAPPLFHGRIGERFGPFRAPPTIIFDPRAAALAPPAAGQKARHRWAMIEEDAYLLPHYLLHAVAGLHQAPLTREARWLADKTPEPGTALHALNIHVGGTFERASQTAAGARVWSEDAFRSNLARLGSGEGSVHVWVRNPEAAQKLLSDLNARPSGTVRAQLITHDWASNEQTARALVRNSDFSGRVTGLVQDRPGYGQNVFGQVAMIGHKNDLRKINDMGIPITPIGESFTTLVSTPFAPNRGMSDLLYMNAMRGTFSRLALRELPSDSSSVLSYTLNRNRDISDKYTTSDALGRRTLTFDQLWQQTAVLNKPWSQQFEKRASQTFGSIESVGGIKFVHDNKYRVDLSGRVRTEAEEDARTSRAAKGFVTGALRYFDELPLLWLDLAGPRDGPLPVAVPRFLTAAGVPARQTFGGPWSLEPLALDIRRGADGRLLRVSVATAETLAAASYEPLAAAEGAPPLLAVRNGTGFEPALESRDDGGFVWTLRHGVTVEFSADGLVEAVASPQGNRVAYVRDARRIAGQTTSDGRRIDIRYADNRPESIAVQGQPRAAYSYHADYWLVEARGNRQTWSIGYDPQGRPARIASAAGDLSLAHDEKGRVTAVDSGPVSVRMEYVDGSNAVRFAPASGPPAEWLLGPVSGPVMPDRAVLLTRNISGRILQVSRGKVQGMGDSREFVPDETVDLVR